MLAIGKEGWLKKFLRWCVESMRVGVWRRLYSENGPKVIDEGFFTKRKIKFSLEKNNNRYIFSGFSFARLPTFQTRGLKITVCALLWQAAFSVSLLITLVKFYAPLACFTFFWIFQEYSIPYSKIFNISVDFFTKKSKFFLLQVFLEYSIFQKIPEFSCCKFFF